MKTRRELGRLAVGAFSWAAFSLPRVRAYAVDSTVRGVKLGITTGSLNPLPEISGKEKIDILIDECTQLGLGTVELASGFFWTPDSRRVRGPNPKTDNSRISEVARCPARVEAVAGFDRCVPHGEKEIREGGNKPLLHIEYIRR